MVLSVFAQVSPSQQGPCCPLYLKVHPSLALSNSLPWFILLQGTFHLRHTIFFYLLIFSLFSPTRLPFMKVFLSVLFIIVSSPWHIINMHTFFTLGSLLHINSHVSACYSFHPPIHPSIFQQYLAHSRHTKYLCEINFSGWLLTRTQVLVWDYFGSAS